MRTQQEYEHDCQEQERMIQEKTGIVQPFLKEFSEKYDLGTGFYEDVTILSGPHGNFFWDTEAGKQLRALNEAGKISISYVKFAGGAFIIEYRFDGNRIYRYKDQIFQAPNSTPINAYFLYDGKQYPVSMEIALAAKELHSAQDYLGVLYSCMRERGFIK